MISLTRKYLRRVLIGACCCSFFLVDAQDSITVEDLRQFSYSFDIEDGVLTGVGAGVLTRAISNAHLVMLGNNSRNQLEEDLDLALAQELEHNNFNTLVMEIGPNSADDFGSI